MPREVLIDGTRSKDCSIAQRMSWAAKRTTERVEDRAWSLLGLLGIKSIQPSYGAGEQAFMILQKEIIAASNDFSIFAWELDAETASSGPFARNPDAFVNCADVKRAICSDKFSLDQLGLEINLPAIPYSMDIYSCALQAHIGTSQCTILLRRESETGYYFRVKSQGGASRGRTSSLRDYKQRSFCMPLDAPKTISTRSYGFFLRTIEPPGMDTARKQILSRDPKTDKNIFRDRVMLLEALEAPRA